MRKFKNMKKIYRKENVLKKVTTKKIKPTINNPTMLLTEKVFDVAKKLYKK